MRKLVFIFFAFIYGYVQADSNACDSCRRLAQVRISNSGLSKIVEKSIEPNLDDISKQIIINGTLKEQIWRPSKECKYTELGKKSDESFQKCPFIPNYDSESGALSVFGKKHPLESKFKDGKINNIKLELVKPVPCENLKCHISFKVTQLNVSGKISAKQLDDNVNLIPEKNINLSMNSNSKPLIYEFDAAVDEKTGRLEDATRVVKGSSQVRIPEMSLNLDIHEKVFDNPDSARKAELNEVYQRVRESLSEYKNKEVLADELRVAKAQLYFQKTNGMKKLTSKQEQVINAEIERELSVAELSKVSQLNLPKTNDPVVQAEYLKKIPTAFYTLPKMSEILDQSENQAQAKLNGYPSTGAYIVSKNAEVLTKLALSNSGILDIITNQLHDNFEDIDLAIDESLTNLPSYIDMISSVPKINSQLIRDSIESADKITVLKQKIEDKSYSEQDRINLKKQLHQEIQEYKKIDAQMSNDSNWMKLQTQIMVDKISEANRGVVSLSMYPKNKICNPTALPAQEDTQKADYDVATEVSVDGFNDYFQKLQASGDLNFCSKQLVNGECKSGQKVKFAQAPKITFDPSSGLYKVYAKTDIGTHGSVDTVFNAKFNLCGKSPCLELTNPKSNASSFVLKFVSLGYMIEKSIVAGSQVLNKEGLLSVPIANLKNIKTNPETGATNFEWELK